MIVLIKEKSMNALVALSIPIDRATAIIAHINLTYALFRYEQAQKLNLYVTNVMNISYI
jgi:hypothetical protein